MTMALDRLQVGLNRHLDTVEVTDQQGSGAATRAARGEPHLVRPSYGSVLGADAGGRHTRVHAPPPTARKGGADQGACADPPDEPRQRGGVAQGRCGGGEGNQTSKYPHCPVKEQILPKGPSAHPRPLLIKQQPPPDRSSAHPTHSPPVHDRPARPDQTIRPSRRRRSAPSWTILNESSGPAADTRSPRTTDAHQHSGSCPLRARPDEQPRVATVTSGQCADKPAGRRICRWQASSATDFPS